MWDVGSQRGSPVDDDVAGLTEGCESRSCQRMRMLTRKIERKKGRCVCVCESWVSFVVAAVEADSFCCYVEISAAEPARLRPVSSPAINASSCLGTRPTSCRLRSSPRSCLRCPCRSPRTVVEVGGGGGGRRMTAQGGRQLPGRSQR